MTEKVKVFNSFQYVKVFNSLLRTSRCSTVFNYVNVHDLPGAKGLRQSQAREHLAGPAEFLRPGCTCTVVGSESSTSFRDDLELTASSQKHF